MPCGWYCGTKLPATMMRRSMLATSTEKPTAPADFLRRIESKNGASRLLWELRRPLPKKQNCAVGEKAANHCG